VFLRHWHLIAVIMALLLVVLPTILLFDGLIEFEYDWHRDAWEADGRPCGYMFFRPPKAAWWSMNTHVLFFTWMFSTPAWARTNRSCVRSLQWMRVLAALWLVGFPLMLYLSRQTL
jgi:hypothetical protein